MAILENSYYPDIEVSRTLHCPHGINLTTRYTPATVNNKPTRLTAFSPGTLGELALAPDRGELRDVLHTYTCTAGIGMQCVFMSVLIPLRLEGGAAYFARHANAEAQPQLLAQCLISMI